MNSFCGICQHGVAEDNGMGLGLVLGLGFGWVRVGWGKCLDERPRVNFE